MFKGRNLATTCSTTDSTPTIDVRSFVASSQAFATSRASASTVETSSFNSTLLHLPSCPNPFDSSLRQLSLPGKQDSPLGSGQVASFIRLFPNLEELACS